MAKDVQMRWVSDDIEKIQTKTNLYLVNYGNAGAFHLFREVFQNSVDELCDTNSNGKKIYTSYDRVTGEITVDDDGRGIPETDQPLEITITKLQAGSKFMREDSKSSGEFGIGITLTVALSKSFSITCFREEEKTAHTIKFEEGKKVEDRVSANNSGRHGTLVKFIPSKKYLGADTEFPFEDAKNWINDLMYLPMDNDKIKIKYELLKDGVAEESFTFKKKEFDELLDTRDSKDSDKGLLPQRLYITGSERVPEEIAGKVYNKELRLDVALSYSIDPEVSLPEYNSWCNFTQTTEGGVHVEAVEKCFCSYMQNHIRQGLSDAQKDKFPITWDDIRSGLVVFLNVATSAQVRFVGNMKQKIGNERLNPIIYRICYREMDKFFSTHQSVYDAYAKMIKANCKARIELQKAKAATQTERMNNLKEHSLKNYIPCINRGNRYRELYIVEGGSAAGSVRDASDEYTQAILLLRGVIPNAYKCTLGEIMENKEISTLVNVLRCGIGKNFDLSKLYFDRINIFTDEDVDGFGISSQLIAFFYRFMPEIIQAGKLYKVFTPLYKIDNKEKPYVANKQEMVDIYQSKLTKNYKIKLNEKDDWLSKSEFRQFLTDTYSYREDLIRVAQSLGNVNKYFVEVALAYLVISNVVRSATDHEDLKELFSNQTFLKNYSSKIQKQFKEVRITEDGRLRGVIGGKFYILKVNERFLSKTDDIIPVYQKYGYQIFVKEKDGETKKMTIGEFLDICTKYYSAVLMRVKGLGELNDYELRDTAMDFNHRVSVQYTLKMAKEEADEIFNTLHGGSQKDLASRKEMMKHYKIKREDLDN